MKSKILIILCILLFQDNFAQNGILDASFGNGGLKTFTLGDKNTRGNHIISLDDNSFIIAGNSDESFYGSQINRGIFISKFLSNGDLDTNFGTNGVISIEGTYSGQTFLRSIIKCGDGKVLASCIINGIPKFIKINPVSGFDNQFGNNGFVDLPPNNLRGILGEFNNGKFIVVSYFYSGTTYSYYFNRYNYDGSIDNSFGSNGGIVNDITNFTYDFCESLKILPNNKFITVGTSSNSPANYYNAHICKFNEDGTPDQAFGTNGVVLTPIGDSGYAHFRDLDLLDDGKIVVSGSYEYSNGTGGFGGSKQILVKYNANGTLDTTFGTNGIVIFNVLFNGNDNFYAVKVQSDNKILGIGASSYPFPYMQTFLNITRLNENGTFDSTFANNGIFLTNNNNAQLSSGREIEIQNDTKIIAVGITKSIETTNTNALVCRFEIENSLNNIHFGIDDNFSIYPNPATDQIYIKGVNQESKLELYNILGQNFNVVKKDINENEIKIDVSNLCRGTYMLKIEVDSKITIKKVVIK
ncbi:MAG: T9SS type A sorting domain-containing protein [Flavobacterium sp.]|nr:T9SS type A sorting domain-containing protein [Flavobacterium sp.]